MVASGIGLILSIYYCASFAKASKGGSNTGTGSTIMAHHMQGCAAVVAFVAIHAKQQKVNPIGQLGVLINFAMYASPLAAMNVVIAKQNSSAMPWPMTLGSLFCCIFWAFTAYFDAKDPYVYVPTMAGAIVAFLQVALKIVYPESIASAVVSTSGAGKKKNHHKLSPHLNSRKVELLPKQKRR